MCSTMIIPPWSCQSPGEYFSDPQVRIWWVSGGKTHESVGLPKDCDPLEFLIFTLVHVAFSNLSKLLFKCFFYQFIAPVASAPGRQILAVTLDLPVTPDFWVAICPAISVLCDPSSHCFLVYSTFYCRKDMSNDFQALYMSELKLEVMHVFLNPEIHNIDETWKKLLKNRTYTKKIRKYFIV